jgi:hypothetical protein
MFIFKVQAIFYERFYNFEIMTGGFLLKNTQWSREFIMQLAHYDFDAPKSWNGADNGAIHMHVLKSVMPHAKNAIRFVLFTFLSQNLYFS